MHPPRRSGVKNILMRGAAVFPPPSTPPPHSFLTCPSIQHLGEEILEMAFLSCLIEQPRQSQAKHTCKTSEFVFVGCSEGGGCLCCFERWEQEARLRVRGKERLHWNWPRSWAKPESVTVVSCSEGLKGETCTNQGSHLESGFFSLSLPPSLLP